MRIFALFLVLFLTSSHLYSQETRYIRDTLYVELRSGQSFKHRILHRGLVSGTAVTLLERSEDDKWSLVRTDKGIEGWLQTQYLATDPAARNQLKVANLTIKNLQAKNAALQNQLTELQTKEQQVSTELTAVTDKSTELSNELATIKQISANAIQLNTDNQRLLEENQMLNNKVDILSTDNQRLADEKDSDDFLNGAFAVLIGVFITLLVPRMWPKKQTDWA